MSEKYKEEIEEILRQAGNKIPTRRPSRSLWGVLGSQISKALGGKSWSFTPGRLMLLALVLIIVGLTTVKTVIWVGILLFIVAYSLFFIKPSAPQEKLWRGRVVGYRATWTHRLKKRLHQYASILTRK